MALTAEQIIEVIDRCINQIILEGTPSGERIRIQLRQISARDRILSGDPEQVRNLCKVFAHPYIAAVLTAADDLYNYDSVKSPSPDAFFGHRSLVQIPKRGDPDDAGLELDREKIVDPTAGQVIVGRPDGRPGFIGNMYMGLRADLRALVMDQRTVLQDITGAGMEKDRDRLFGYYWGDTGIR